MVHALASRKPETALRIGEPHDSFEREADRMAEQVVGGGLQPARAFSLASMNIGSPLRRKCACGGAGECEECKEKNLQRKAESAAGREYAPPIVDEVLRSPGQPLDASARGFFEPRFGHDFSHVRIHRGGRENESARAVNALAYTVGNHIVLGPGAGAGDRKLLAHELTHTIQQSGPVRRLQRVTADPAAIPKGLTCVTDATPGSGAELTLTGVKVTPPALNPTQKKQVAEYYKMWVAGGSKDFIAVEGYASPDTANDSADAQKSNWGYSCKRAEMVQEEFVKLGVPRSRVITFAHGETDKFSSSLKDADPNRRVEISRVQVGPVGGGAAQAPPVQGPTSMQVTGKADDAKKEVKVEPNPKPVPPPTPVVPSQETEPKEKERVFSITIEGDWKNDWKSPQPPPPPTKGPSACDHGFYQLGFKWNNGITLKKDRVEFLNEPELDVNISDAFCAQNPAITAQINLFKFIILPKILEADLVGIAGLPDGWATGLQNFPFSGAGQVKLQSTPFAKISPDFKGLKIGIYGGLGFEQGVQGEDQRTRVLQFGGFIGLDYDVGPQKKDKD